MAEKRMFTKKITESDSFLDMPASTQCLYFHLNLNADDDGFVNNPKRIMRDVRANDDDLKLLLMKNFIIAFESGLIVIKHWRMHNYIAKDRYHPTDYKEELSMLGLKEGDRVYTLVDNQSEDPCIQPCIQSVYNMYTENRLDKNRLDKSSVDNARAHVDKEWFDKTWEKYPKKWNEAMAFTRWMEKFLNVIEGNEKDLALEIYRATMLYLDRYKINNIGDPDLKFVRPYDEWLKEECDYWIAQYNAIKKRMAEEDGRS